MHTYQLLNTAFTISSFDLDVFRYIDSFLAQYEPFRPDLPVTRTIDIQVKRGKVPATTQQNAGRLPVHITKHPYWNFDAVCHSVNPLKITWPSRKTEIIFIDEAAELHIKLDDSIAEPFAGEYVFHCMRSFALYLRESSDSYFLHASAVCWHNKGVLFAGNANAGKTTLFIKSVLHHDALPFSNDRVFLTTEKQVRGHSWPSYVSLCEGTILQNPVLLRAAKAYDETQPLYKTIQWAKPLKNSFSKTDKRIYPHQWLTEVTRKKYIQTATIAAIAFVRLGTRKGLKIAPVDLSVPQDEHRLVEQLQQISFDSGEPSFKPWHQLPFPSATKDFTLLINRFRSSGAKLFNMDVSVTEIDAALHQLKALL
jgi:hypothetical protein